MSWTEGGKVKVFLAGEGANELGSRIGHPAYQSDARPGVLCALLKRVQADGWVVGAARDWKSIRKFKAGGGGHADTRNVLGAARDALEAGCEVLAFSRDQDRDPERREAVEDGIRLVSERITGAPEVIGGVAVPTLEAWILALLGTRNTEQLTPKWAEEELVDRGMKAKDGDAMVEVVEAANLDAIPDDAQSLSTWLGRARAVLPPRVAAQLATRR